MMPLAESFTTFIGLATKNVPIAEPRMMTYSHGCQSTPMWPPMAAKPPNRQPMTTVMPMTKVMGYKPFPRGSDPREAYG